MNLIAKLQLPDGRVFEVSDEFETKNFGDDTTDEDSFRLTISDWTRGNQSCDCNRSALLNEQFDLNLVDPNADDERDYCLPCGETIKLLSLVIDGTEIELD